MSEQHANRVIAFAGICQAAKLVQDIARSNRCDESALRSSLQSVLITHADTTLDVFGELQNLELGFSVINSQLSGGQHPRNAELTRYMVSLLSLERKIAKRPDLMNVLGQRITQLERQLQHFDLLDSQILSSLAAIYSDVISPNGPRIQVAGNITYLQQSLVQHKVRALLLAGIRACVLWRQLGGSRRHLVFSRGKYLDECNNFLKRIS